MPSNDAVVGLYAYSPDVFDVIRGLEPSSAASWRSPTSTGTTRSRARSRAIAPRLVGGRRHAGSRCPRSARDRPNGRQQGRAVIDGLLRIPLQRFEDERGWFMELRRESALPKPTRQTNVSFSRRGVIRGLHYHERGQDDLFVCLQGTARVVVLDRDSGETFTEDIGDDNPVAIYVPGRHAHGFEALTDCSSVTT